MKIRHALMIAKLWLGVASVLALLSCVGVTGAMAGLDHQRIEGANSGDLAWSKISLDTSVTGLLVAGARVVGEESEIGGKCVAPRLQTEKDASIKINRTSILFREDDLKKVEEIQVDNKSDFDRTIGIQIPREGVLYSLVIRKGTQVRVPRETWARFQIPANSGIFIHLIPVIAESDSERIARLNGKEISITVYKNDKEPEIKRIPIKTKMGRGFGIPPHPKHDAPRSSQAVQSDLPKSFDIWEVPPGQPEQMRSQVHYDPKLTDPFFESDEWSYPYWIIEYPDGHLENARSGDGSPVKDPPRLKHTAKCFSTSFGVKHLVKFCEARLSDGDVVELLIHEMNPAYRDSLRVRIRNGKFACQYWISDDVGAFTWTTTRQKLTLDKKVYKKGDVIKGRIDFECAMKVIDPKNIERWGKDPSTTIKVFGVFRTTVE